MLLILGGQSTRTAETAREAAQAQAAANACAELGLAAIRAAGGFSGGGQASIGGGTCTYAVDDLGAGSGRVRATGTAFAAVRIARIQISSSSPHLVISAWQETNE